MSPQVKESKKDPKESNPEPQPGNRSITITVPDFKLDMSTPQSKFKLALLAMLLVIFIFALFMFTRSNLATNDMFDFSRIQYNLPKLYSISFIAFVVLFSLSMALAIYYGFGTNRREAVFALVIVVVLSLIGGLLASPYIYAFLGFGSAIAAAIVLSSLSKTISFSDAWGISSKALLLLLLFAFIGTYMKVSANQNGYFNTFVVGIANSAPSLVSAMLPSAARAGQSSLQACADAINSFSITPSYIESISPESNVSDALASSGGAAYASMPQAQQQQLTQALYGTCVNMTAYASNNVKSQLATAISSYNVSQAAGAINPNTLVTPQLVKQMISSVPALKSTQQYLPLVSAVGILSLISLVNLVIHVLASIILWLLTKAI